MAAELGLLSLTQLQELAQSHQQNQHPQNPIVAWMWNPKQAQEDDKSWEVRAFEEDTGNILGTTWPPRSYTCTFCRREFRSAQALGGHMNVHRRDRARLHQTQPIASIHHKNSSRNPSSSLGTSAFGIPTQEFSSNGGGFCLLYQLPNPNGIFTAPTTMNSCNHLIGQPVSFPIAQLPANSSHSFSTIAEVEPFNGGGNSVNGSNNNNNCKELVGEEEVDLELRLGHRSTTSSSSTSS